MCLQRIQPEEFPFQFEAFKNLNAALWRHYNGSIIRCVICTYYKLTVQKTDLYGSCSCSKHERKENALDTFRFQFSCVLSFILSLKCCCDFTHFLNNLFLKCKQGMKMYFPGYSLQKHTHKNTMLKIAEPKPLIVEPCWNLVL